MFARAVPCEVRNPPCDAQVSVLSGVSASATSGLNLVIAAIVYWNSTYIADAIAHLRAIGEPALDELLAHVSPVGWGHSAFSGDFLWDRAAAFGSGRRPLNVARVRLAE